MKNEKNKQHKNKTNIAAKIMALVLALMMLIAAGASLIYALIYA